MPRLKKVDQPFEQCIGLLEYRSIAVGIESTDGMLKQATVELLQSQPISPGKYISLIQGEVDDVRSALERGEQLAGPDVVDRLILPNPHPDLVPAINGEPFTDPMPAVGVVETLAVATTLACADLAPKQASVRIVALGLGLGLGGKGYLTLCGPEEDVLVAVDLAVAHAERAGKLLRRIVIPQLHPDMQPYLSRAKGYPCP